MFDIDPHNIRIFRSQSGFNGQEVQFLELSAISSQELFNETTEEDKEISYEKKETGCELSMTVKEWVTAYEIVIKRTANNQTNPVTTHTPKKTVSSIPTAPKV